MDFQKLINSLERFVDILPAMVGGVSATDARWKPESGGWSILEVVCHLADEEVEDFGRRLKLCLDDPKAPWPPIEPENVAVERKYNEQDLPETLQRFLISRRESVSWLRSLETPDWSNTYQHPDCGPLRAGDIMLSWAAHDQLHIRQIAKRMFEMNLRDGAGYSSEYAGEWKA